MQVAIERGRINITSRWVSQIGYMDDTATVEIIFAPAVVPLITFRGTIHSIRY